MFAFTNEQVLSLPVDELALAVVADFLGSEGWNEYNYSLETQQAADLGVEQLRAVAEAFAWAHAHGLMARTPGQSDPNAVFVTRRGHRAVDEGLGALRAEARLGEDLHPEIQRRARRQFLLGELEQSIFVSMKAVEVRARTLGHLSYDDYGVSLMNKAFGRNGPLTDASATEGERDGMRALFAGANAVLRNPSGHRDIDYDDPAEAAEGVAVASLLMRMLDRIEQRSADQDR